MDSTWTSNNPDPRVRNRDPDLPSYKSVVEKDLPAVRARAYDMYVRAFPATKFGNLEELVTHNPGLAQAYTDIAHHMHRKQIKKARRDVQIRAFEMYLSKHPVTPHSSIWHLQAQNYKQADHYINKAYVTLELERKALEAKRLVEAEEAPAAKQALVTVSESQQREEALAAQQAQQRNDAIIELHSTLHESLPQIPSGGKANVMTREEREKMERDRKLQDRENLWISIVQQRRLYKHNVLIDKTNGKGQKDEATKVIGERLKSKEKTWREMKKNQGELVKEFVEWRNQELEEKEGVLERVWFRVKRPLWRYRWQRVKN